MPRPLRTALGGIVYHVLNRANVGLTIFEKEADYAAFEEALTAAREHFGTRLLAYCLMPNHWHFVLWPREDGELSDFMWWLTLTHTQRWHAHRESTGRGHLYQGRFKSFPIQDDEHLLTVGRYVERNALRAGLVRAAEAWRWGSLWRRIHGDRTARALLDEWPLRPPRDWCRLVNEPQTQAELACVRAAIQRGRPFGDDGWMQRTAAKLGLTSTLQPRGRPRADREKGS